METIVLFFIQILVFHKLGSILLEMWLHFRSEFSEYFQNKVEDAWFEIQRKKLVEMEAQKNEEMKLNILTTFLERYLDAVNDEQKKETRVNDNSDCNGFDLKTRLKLASIRCSSQVEPGDFTSDLTNRLRALYAQ